MLDLNYVREIWKRSRGSDRQHFHISLDDFVRMDGSEDD